MTSRPIRDFVKERLAPFPALTHFARLSYATALNARLEAGALLRLLIARARSGGAKEECDAVLPVQPPSRVRISAMAASLRPEALIEFCRTRGLACGVGGDALYLPPSTWAASLLSEFQHRYPPGSGIKIARAPGGVDQPYMTARLGRHVARRMSYPHRWQLLTYNVLYAHGLAPRLDDLVEIESADRDVHVAYVVEHVDAEPLRGDDCTQIVESLQSLERRGLLKLISAAGWSGIDFQKPDGNGNIIRSSARQRALYVDIHNFILPGFRNYLHAAWESAAAQSYSPALLTDASCDFYQRLLGTPIARTGDVSRNAEIGLRLLAQAQLSIAQCIVFAWGDRHVLEYADDLRSGARWLHAFTKEASLPAMERLLLALGCTRFRLSAQPADAADAAPPWPPECGTKEATCLLRYRADAQEGEWAAAALHLPWQYMLYEHPARIGPLSAQLDALAARLPIRLVGSEEMTGEGRGTVALIERTGA